MAFLNWSSEYEFGIPEIDKQHKRWLELLNKFYDQLQQENFNNHLLTLLDEAIEYTKYHFTEEEKMMESIGYEATQRQKELHREIGAKIEAYRKTLKEGKPLLSVKVTNEFKGWFNMHILQEDKKYVPVYKASRK